MQPVVELKRYIPEVESKKRKRTSVEKLELPMPTKKRSVGESKSPVLEKNLETSRLSVELERSVPDANLGKQKKPVSDEESPDFEIKKRVYKKKSPGVKNKKKSLFNKKIDDSSLPIVLLERCDVEKALKELNQPQVDEKERKPRKKKAAVRDLKPEPDPITTCHICDQTVTTKSFRQHLLVEHAGIGCSFCDKVFTSSADKVKYASIVSDYFQAFTNKITSRFKFILDIFLGTIATTEKSSATCARNRVTVSPEWKNTFDTTFQSIRIRKSSLASAAATEHLITRCTVATSGFTNNCVPNRKL